MTAADQRIDRAVANGRISAERAARIKERVADRVTRLVNEWHPRRLHNGAAA